MERLVDRPKSSRWILVLLLAASFAAQAQSADYARELATWKAARVEFLKGAHGYLNLVGLHWLGRPANSFGSDASSDLVFPPKVPARIGAFLIVDKRVRMRIDEGIQVLHEGRPVREIDMRDDSSSNPVTVTLGSLAWTVIKRDGNFAVRVRDFEHPAIHSFDAIDYFPVDEGLRIIGQLQRYDAPRQVRANTVVEGLEYKPKSPGTVHFQVSGKSYDLEAYSIDSGLMFVFGDLTTGRETYPAGRFLYADAANEHGTVILDFNKAENPPCAFNEFATCPVASPRNRLDVAIPAGERYDPVAH